MGQPSWLHQYRNKLQANLYKKLTKANKVGAASNKKMDIIIQFNHKLSAHHYTTLQNNVKAPHYKIMKNLKIINALKARVTLTGLRRLCKQHCVSCMYLDHKVHTRLNIATPAVGSSAVQKTGLSGEGVTIAVVDTGVYPHRDLTRPVNRIIGFKDVVNRRRTPYDDNGHGTHVAGDALGNGFSSRGKFKGPAPKANLVAVKVLGKDGSGSVSDVISGIQWVVNNRKRYKIRILNLSLGTPSFTKCSEDPLCQAASQAWRRGIAVVAAAGNSGPSARTIESPGINPRIITVAAVDDRHSIRQSDDKVAVFSSRGPVKGARKPDIAAPGVEITSLCAPNSLLCSQKQNGRYLRLSGTSMSTPIVAGALAQILQRSPTMSPNQLKAVIRRTAINLRVKATVQGSGEINVRFLLNRNMGVIKGKKPSPFYSLKNKIIANKGRRV